MDIEDDLDFDSLASEGLSRFWSLSISVFFVFTHIHDA